MKIDGQHPKLPVQDKSAPKGKEKASVQSDKNKPSVVKKKETDQFTVSKMKARIKAESDANLEKVKALKEKIKKGEYEIDTQKLAGKLIEDSLLEDI